MVTVAEELLVKTLVFVGEVITGVGAVLGAVIDAGALKRKVNEPVSGASVALNNVYATE